MSKLSTSLKKFKDWRRDLTDAIVEYQTWSEQQSAGDGEQDLRVYELIESLKQDKITIALTGEYSRGKTELINAIFFSDHKQRVLPSSAGRTTMCPTEILYDPKESPYIKLLPIETRKTSVSISEYKNTPIHWTTIHILKVDSVEEVREAFQQITRTKKVHVREAQELGLYESCLQYLNGEIPEDDMLEIPIWRHAIINYPHPLLIQGLNIIDTPGLNALGAEPELTYNILPSAHAILYLLAADTGVTKTDLEIWLNHVNYQGSNKSAPKYVVMNKIDTLWDGLGDRELLQQTIDKQVDDIARTLHVNRSDIYPVSAQKALTARVKNDANLLKQSGIEALENKLAFEVLPMKYELIRNKVIYEISTRLQNSRNLLDTKLQHVEKQISDLKNIGDSNLDTLQKMVSHMRQEKEKYDKELEGFQLTRSTLSKQAKVLLSHLGIDSFNRLIKQTRKQMHQSWTTHGLKGSMATMFKGATDRMELVSKQADEIKSVVEKIYYKLHTEYGLTQIQPAKLLLATHFIELKKLSARADAFRKSPVTTMTEQHFVIQKFFITLVSQALQIFNDCNSTAKYWFKTMVQPVYDQIQEHKNSIDRNLVDLKKIHENLDSLGGKIEKLEQKQKDLQSQIKLIETLNNRINIPAE